MESNNIKYHTNLAEYFSRKPLYLEEAEKKKPNTRKLVELPWQLLKSNQWTRLRDTVADLPILVAIWDRSRNEVLSYWAELDKHLGSTIEESYADKWESFGAEGGDLSALSLLLQIKGAVCLARDVNQAYVRQCRNRNDKPALAIALGDMASILRNDGQFSEAQNIEHERAQLFEELGDDRGLAWCYGSQARYMNDHASKLSLLRSQEKIARKLGDSNLLQACLGNMSIVYGEEENFSEAEQMRKEGEQICENCGFRYELQAHYLNHSVLLKGTGRWDEALNMLQRSEDECRQLGFQDSLATCLGQQANILSQIGRKREALQKNAEAERIFRSISNQFALANCLWNQAVTYNKMWKRRKARVKIYDALAVLFKTSSADQGHYQMRRTFARALKKLDKSSFKMSWVVSLIVWLICSYILGITLVIILLIGAISPIIWKVVWRLLYPPDGYCYKCGGEFIAIDDDAVCLKCGLGFKVSYLKEFLARKGYYG